jgi:hypothetical protein
MKSLSKLFFCASLGLATLTMGCAEMNTGARGEPGSAAKPSSTKTDIPVATGLARIAPGSQADTLDACLARIPGDATDGQRMLATLSCERDAKARISIDAVPGQ